MYTEALQKGCDHARFRVIFGDGAVWIWNIADREFPGVIQIVDIYHAREHLWVLAGKLFPTDERRKKRWATQLQNKLDQGKIELLVRQQRCVPAANTDAADCFTLGRTVSNAIVNAYPAFRGRNLFVCSGARGSLSNRDRQTSQTSGNVWTARRANAIIALRCPRLSGRSEDYWASLSNAS